MNPLPRYNEKGELDTRLRVDPVTGDVGIGTSKEKEHMKHDKTFEAINKLKEVELELHRLKNALEMTDRALQAKHEWVELNKDEVFEIANFCKGQDIFALAKELGRKLKEKNHGN